MPPSKYHKKEIILASRSKRRIDLLKELKIPFKAMPSNIKEPPYEEEGEMTPQQYAIYCATQKARDIAEHVSKAVVIGMDTIGEYNGRVLGKPADRKHAEEMIKYLSGTTHNVITGICIIDADSETEFTAAEITKVTFTELSDNEIDAYTKLGVWDDVAAGYAIQGVSALFVEKIEGDYFNVVGFPIFRFAHLMKQMGMPILELIQGK